MSEKLFVGDVEDRKLKRKIKYASTMDADSELSLSLCLGGNNMVCESSYKFASKSLKAYEDLDFAPKSKGNSNGQAIMPVELQFPCKFCDKKFHNAQALGGHQNAHKHERALSKMNKEIDKGTLRLGAHLCPCSTMANHLSFCGSPCYHRVNMNPMAHMYAMPWPSSGLDYNNHGSFNTSLSMQRYGLTNSWGPSVETQQRLNHRDLEFGSEPGHVPSLVGDATNRVVTARTNFGSLQ